MDSLLTFDALISKSYCFNQVEYDSDPHWALLKELYYRNFIDRRGRNYSVLPKKIHQIWLGSPLPVKYLPYIDTWKRLNPEWEYRLWTERDLGDVETLDMKVFDAIHNYGQKSDYLRYHILNKYGGLYIDTDFECLRTFNELTFAEFLIGVGYPSKLELYNSLIGCTVQHPIMRSMIEEMNNNMLVDKNWVSIFETTGTFLLTRTFFKVVDKYTKRVVVLPTDYFYPFPNIQSCMDKGNGRDYVKDCSYTVHYWDVSWVKNEK